ncbi:hypothetical protein [Sedimentitalea arenosa]|uniref:Uncharacterized protein n=1 Tax=Sedimentitalea arenosa TaxID=2798803 RepID=A0A8J7LXB9_9RHOB|nr:hypothetical protein [Arenibacterium arenosum]MBJ6373395.1 hypothetical protein [Arenibacterium arenosum]
MTRLWLFRPGKYGEAERPAQDDIILSVDFGIRQNIFDRKDRDTILEVLADVHRNAKLNALKNLQRRSTNSSTSPRQATLS